MATKTYPFQKLLLELMQGGNDVQDMALKCEDLIPFRLANSCKSVSIPRGLVSVQRFQLLLIMLC